MTHTALIVRHARPDWNDDQRWQGGEVDRDLVPAAVRETQSLSSRVLNTFGGRPPVVFSSKAIRAVATARLLVPNVEPIQLKGLSELRSGLLSGLTYQEVRGKFPDFAKSWWSSDDLISPPGGEPVEVLVRRVSEAILDCEDSGRPWLAVTHLGVIRAVMQIFGMSEQSEVGNLEGIVRRDVKWERWGHNTDEP